MSTSELLAHLNRRGRARSAAVTLPRGWRPGVLGSWIDDEKLS